MDECLLRTRIQPIGDGRPSQSKHPLLADHRLKRFAEANIFGMSVIGNHVRLLPTGAV